MGSEIYDWLHSDPSNFIADLQSKFQQAGVTVSPLVLDLDGDGVETIGKSAGIHFDHDGNDFAETTGWAGTDEGLLAWGRNGNGKIDDGSELFGNKTKLADGSNAANGFAALAEFDSNHDGVVDGLDAGFSLLRIWKDADSNAVVSDGELLGLDAAGVRSITVAYVEQSITDTQGNQHLQIGQYTRGDGSIGAMDDVWFAADMARTKDLNTVVITDDIAALPDLEGFGNVQSLHQAMARDTTGKLEALVRQFTRTADNDERKAVFDDILYAWTGSALYAANDRGSYFGDARKLYALEAFLGKKFVQGSGTNAGTNDPGPNATQVLGEAYGLLSDRLNAQLMAQTRFKDLFNSIELTWNADALAISVDVSKTLDKLSALYDADSEQASSIINAFGGSLKASGDFGAQTLAALRAHGNRSGTGFPLLLAAMGAKYVLGDSGNNEMAANAGQDTILMGMDGSDRLTGNNGDDVLAGGTGNDSLYGGLGSDTYVLARGDEADTISDYDITGGNIDVAQFTDVASTEVTSLQRKNNDLVLKYGATDQLTVKGYFDPHYPGYRIERFSFNDGVSWDDTAIKAQVITNGSASNDYIIGYNDGSNRIYGLDGNDILYGGAKDDFIDGDNGNDTLNGNSGNDILQGGVGTDTLNDTVGSNLFNGGTDNDVLNGGSGNDFYIGGAGNDTIVTGAGHDVITFNRGDGQDTVAASTGRDNTLSLGGCIDYADLSLSRTANDLVLTTGVNESLTFKGWYASSNNHSVANLQMVVEGSSDYDAASPDSLQNQKIAQFDFDAMVSRFDEAKAASPGLSSWSLSSAMLEFHLGSSDTAAIGGDLAYQYGRYGDLSGMSVNAAQTLLAGAQFGSASQAMQGGTAVQDMAPRLM